MSIFLSCETCLKPVVSVTACIMDRLLVGISDDETREELLSTHDLTLNICRGMEAESLHMKALRSEEINKIKDMTKKKKKSGHDKYQP